VSETRTDRAAVKAAVERATAFLRAVESYGDDEEGNVIASECNSCGGPDSPGYLPLNRDDLRTVLDALERREPAEQQSAEATGGEQVQDGAAAEAAEGIARFLTHFREDSDDTVIEGLGRYCLTVGMLRAVLAECEAATARAESATVLPERWRALIAERDEARELARVSLDILRNVSDEPMRELFEVDDMGKLPDWFTGYGKPSATQAPDAAPDGRSATLRAEDGVQASGSELEFEGRSAGLSERCCATKLGDGVRHHCDNDSSGPHTHECGDCAHRWNDDTTEDDRG